MSKRGRRWASKLKKKLRSEKLSSIRDSIAVKKKATAEQLRKVKLGVRSFKEIEQKMNRYKKEYTITGEGIYKDKFERLNKIIELLKKMKINEAKKLGQEYDNLYPNDF